MCPAQCRWRVSHHRQISRFRALLCQRGHQTDSGEDRALGRGHRDTAEQTESEDKCGRRMQFQMWLCSSCVRVWRSNWRERDKSEGAETDTAKTVLHLTEEEGHEWDVQCLLSERAEQSSGDQRKKYLWSNARSILPISECYACETAWWSIQRQQVWITKRRNLFTWRQKTEW